MNATTEEAATNDDKLAMWAVYDNPTDYPGKFVARLFVIGRGTIEPTKTTIVRNTLPEVQSHFVLMGLTRLARSPTDDPVIVETWL